MMKMRARKAKRVPLKCPMPSLPKVRKVARTKVSSMMMPVRMKERKIVKKKRKGRIGMSWRRRPKKQT